MLLRHRVASSASLQNKEIWKISHLQSHVWSLLESFLRKVIPWGSWGNLNMDQVLLLCTSVLVIVNGAMIDYIIKCWCFREIVSI